MSYKMLRGLGSDNDSEKKLSIISWNKYVYVIYSFSFSTQTNCVSKIWKFQCLPICSSDNDIDPDMDQHDSHWWPSPKKAPSQQQLLCWPHGDCCPSKTWYTAYYKSCKVKYFIDRFTEATLKHMCKYVTWIQQELFYTSKTNHFHISWDLNSLKWGLLPDLVAII